MLDPFGPSCVLPFWSLPAGQGSTGRAAINYIMVDVELSRDDNNGARLGLSPSVFHVYIHCHMPQAAGRLFSESSNRIP